MPDEPGNHDPLAAWRRAAPDHVTGPRAVPRWAGPVLGAGLAVGLLTLNLARPAPAPPPPTAALSAEPTGQPTAEPTGEPTGEPTAEPTGQPTAEPTGAVAPPANPVPQSATTTSWLSAPPPPGPDEAGFLSWGGAQWAVGRPGDAIALGDWNCDSRPTLALLRPSSGDVYRFDDWPSDGGRLTASVLGRFPGARRLLGRDVDGDRCDDLLVEGADGSLSLVHSQGRSGGPRWAP